LIIIKNTNNGYILKIKNSESPIEEYVFEHCDDTNETQIECATRLLYQVLDEIKTWDDSKYSEKRIVIKTQPGESYSFPEGEEPIEPIGIYHKCGNEILKYQTEIKENLLLAVSVNPI